MNRFFESRWLFLVLRIVLAGIFLSAGISKAQDPWGFAESIASFQMLPPLGINLLALGLPPFEIILGLMLLSGWNKRPALLAVLGLSLIFIVVLIQGWLRGLQMNCGCFGSGDASPQGIALAIMRDLMIFGAAGMLYLKNQSLK